MNVFPWLLTVLALVFMYPWARYLLNEPRRVPTQAAGWILTALTTVALSVGALSLVMLWIALLGIRIDWRLTAALCTALSVIGWIVGWQAKSVQKVHCIGSLGSWKWPTMVILIISLLILFNAIYWPFGLDDAVTIYATYGKQIATTGQLPRGNLYETYPMLIPLTYAFTHQIAGWIDEYLAALIPAVLSIGVLGATYILLDLDWSGIVATLLVALTPMFTHWASAGYVDLPAGFFYGMSGYFLRRLDESQSWTDALLTGIMAGLAAWTKNSGLLIVVSIAMWGMYQKRNRKRRPFPNPFFRYLGFIVAGFLVVAAPWYIRNMSMAGVLVPPTGWTWNAQRTFANLFPYLIDHRYFPIGWLFTAGLLFGLWRFWHRGEDELPLIFYMPFFVVWWALFSYDVRFLLTVTPFIAMLGARLIRAISGSVSQLAVRKVGGEIILWLRMPAYLLILILAIPAVSAAVDHKTEMLHSPLMSDADKHRVRLGADRYNMAIYLRTLPPGSRVWTQDLLLPYQTDWVKMTIGGWPTAAALTNYDYWVLSPGESPPEWLRNEPVHIQGGYRLYALSH